MGRINMAKVIEAPKLYTPKENEMSLFLGGGITNCPDWQKELIELLKDTPDLVMFNPRRANFPIHDPNAAEEQILGNIIISKRLIFLYFGFLVAP